MRQPDDEVVIDEIVFGKERAHWAASEKVSQN